MNVKTLDVYETSLSDVHGTACQLSELHDEGPVVVSLSSRDAAEDANAFGVALEEKLGPSPVPVMRVVYLKDVPLPFHSIAKGMIKKQQNEGRDLLLDWKGRFHQDLGLEPKLAHLVVVAADGTVKGPVSGPPTDENIRAFEALLA